jgi:hypothetical protein
MVVAREVAGFAEANDTQSGAHRALSRASVMPVTSASTWSQTGAVKELRKGTLSAVDRRRHRRRGQRGRGAMSGHRDGRIESRRMRLDAFQAQIAAF